MPGRGFPKHVLAIGTWIAAGLAAGCGAPDLGDRLVDYETHLADALGQAPGIATASPLPVPLPPRRERRIAVSDHRIGGLDFLAIQGCRLSELVGHRNSPLGRVMVPSQRLIHELRVLDLAGECLPGLDPARSARLLGVLEKKRSERAIHLWNALWTGEEIEAHLSPSVPAMARDPDVRVGLLRCLAVVRRPVSTAADAEDLEQALSLLRREHPTGAMLWRLDQARHHLAAVAELLETRAGGSCSVEDRRAVRVFEWKVVPLQAELAALERRVGGRLAALGELFSLTSSGLAASPTSMQQWARARIEPAAPDGVWQRYRRERTRHTRAWRPVLSACGRLPESD